MSKAIELSEVLGTGAFDNGTAPIIDVVEAVYDEVRRVAGATTAHNCEMFFFETFEKPENQVEVPLYEIAENIEEFEEIGYYGVYVLFGPEDTVNTAVPVKEANLLPDGVPKQLHG